MKNYRRVTSGIQWLAILLVLTGLTACGAVTNSGSTTAGTSPVKEEIAPRVGYTAPDFEVKDYTGKTVKLSDYRGKPVLLNFWATWCPPCKVEMPELQAAYQAHQQDGLILLGINLGESPATIKKYVEEQNFNWPMLPDPDGKLKTTFNVIGYPTTVFIDQSGIVRSVQIGGMDRQILESKLSQFLARA